jgi:hypothetical protein
MTINTSRHKNMSITENLESLLGIQQGTKIFVIYRHLSTRKTRNGQFQIKSIKK